MKEYKISQICEVVSGGTPSTKIASYWGGNILWLTPKDLSNNSAKWINESISTITEEGLKNSSAQMLPSEAVLLSSRAPIGYLALAARPLCTNQGFKSMICNKNVVLPEYLYYLLQTKVDDLNNISTGSTFKELSASLLKNFKVYIHEINEQQHIVDILGSIDDKIENNELKIKQILKLYSLKYNELISDYPYNSMFSEIASVESGKRPPIKENENNDTVNIPIIGASSVMGYTNEFLYNERILVIGRVGTHGVVQPIFEKAWPSDNTLVIRSEFYSFVYNVLCGIDYQGINKGSTQPLITQTDIKNTRICLPERSKLKEFEECYPMELIKNYNVESAKLNKLKQLYLQKFFG